MATVYLLVGVTPKEVRSLVEPDSGVSRFLDWDRTTPLLRHMQLRDVEIAGSVRFIAGAADGDIEEAGYSVLASGTSGPLILRQRTASKLTFRSLFHTERSTLEFRVAFPVLIANLVQLARQEAGIGEASGIQTGVLTTIKLKSDSEYTIEGPDGLQQRGRSDEAGQLRGVSASMVGRYRVAGTGNERTLIGANLLSSEETTLNAVDSIEFDGQSVSSAVEVLVNDRPLWSMLTLLAFGVLLVEWWFFQRPHAFRVLSDRGRNLFS